MNLKLGSYELEAGRSGSGLGSYYSKLEMSALILCAVLKNSYFRHCWEAMALITTWPSYDTEHSVESVVKVKWLHWGWYYMACTINVKTLFHSAIP